MTVSITRYIAAAIQFEPALGRKQENIARLLDLTEDAARRGARLIVHPEMATTGYCWYSRDEVRPLVESIPGPTTDRFGELARRYACYIVVCLPEVDLRSGIFYNSAALVGPRGLVGVYRKTHSFISEPKWAKDGDLGLPVWETELGRIGIAICMDAGYFETARLLALQDCEVICFPTNWLDEKSPAADWITRAYENGSYFIAANRYGLERGVQFSGGSCIIGPDGKVLAVHDSGDAVVCAEVDLTAARARSLVPGGPPEKLTARRPELYENLTLNAYLWSPLDFFGLYGQRPLPLGRRSAVAAVQLAPVPGDLKANLAAMAQALEELPVPADLVVFPEYALTGSPLDHPDVALVTSQAPWVSRLIDLAQRYRTHLVAGFARRGGSRIYSAALLVGPGGQELAMYQKAHVIGAEAGLVSPGADRPPIIDLPLGRVGLLLGSDLCFPESARALALEGCDLLAVPAGPGLPSVQPGAPTAIPLSTPGIVGADPAHFHIGRQRAVENSCYLAFAALPAPGGLGQSAVFGPTLRSRDEEHLLGVNGEGVVVRTVDTHGQSGSYPTSAVRAKDLLRMRQPYLYDRLQVIDYRE